MAPGTLVCPQPIVYWLGKVDSGGQRARLAWAGTPSVSADDFEVTLADASPDRPGALIVGQHSASKPLGGGTVLVEDPVVLSRFSIEADGTAVVRVPLGERPDLVGKEVYFQVVYRGSSAENDIGMSDGLHVDVCK